MRQNSPATSALPATARPPSGRLAATVRQRNGTSFAPVLLPVPSTKKADGLLPDPNIKLTADSEPVDLAVLKCETVDDLTGLASEPPDGTRSAEALDTTKPQRTGTICCGGVARLQPHWQTTATPLVVGATRGTQVPLQKRAASHLRHQVRNNMGRVGAALGAGPAPPTTSGRPGVDTRTRAGTALPPPRRNLGGPATGAVNGFARTCGGTRPQQAEPRNRQTGSCCGHPLKGRNGNDGAANGVTPVAVWARSPAAPLTTACKPNFKRPALQQRQLKLQHPRGFGSGTIPGPERRTPRGEAGGGILGLETTAAERRFKAGNPTPVLRSSSASLGEARPGESNSATGILATTIFHPDYFRPLKQLGVGAFATVYLVEQLSVPKRLPRRGSSSTRRGSRSHPWQRFRVDARDPTLENDDRIPTQGPDICSSRHNSNQFSIFCAPTVTANTPRISARSGKPSGEGIQGVPMARPQRTASSEWPPTTLRAADPSRTPATARVACSSRPEQTDQSCSGRCLPDVRSDRFTARDSLAARERGCAGSLAHPTDAARGDPTAGRSNMSSNETEGGDHALSAKSEARAAVANPNFVPSLSASSSSTGLSLESVHRLRRQSVMSQPEYNDFLVFAHAASRQKSDGPSPGSARSDVLSGDASRPSAWDKLTSWPEETALIDQPPAPDGEASSNSNSSGAKISAPPLARSPSSTSTSSSFSRLHATTPNTGAHLGENPPLFACKVFKLRGGSRGTARLAAEREGGAFVRPKILPISKVRREVMIQQSLAHPNIVKIFGTFSDVDNFYILLEYCPNGTLDYYVRFNYPEQRLPEPEARRLGRQLLDACHHMADRHVLHRDIKLQNLYLDDNFNLKVGDFGLARQWANYDHVNMTVVGTPNYIAPEVLGSNGYTNKADVWSFGVVMFSLLCGSCPFERYGDPIKTLQAVRQGVWNIPNRVPLSNKARDLLRFVLTSDPESRPTWAQLRRHAFFSSLVLPSERWRLCTERGTLLHNDRLQYNQYQLQQRQHQGGLQSESSGSSNTTTTATTTAAALTPKISGCCRPQQRRDDLEAGGDSSSPSLEVTQDPQPNGCPSTVCYTQPSAACSRPRRHGANDDTGFGIGDGKGSRSRTSTCSQSTIIDVDFVNNNSDPPGRTAGPGGPLKRRPRFLLSLERLPGCCFLRSTSHYSGPVDTAPSPGTHSTAPQRASVPQP